MKFSIEDFFGKCGHIPNLFWIWSHLLKKSLMENFIFCVVGCQNHQFKTCALSILVLWKEGRKKKKKTQRSAYNARKTSQIYKYHVTIIFLLVYIYLYLHYSPLQQQNMTSDIPTLQDVNRTLHLVM